MERDPGEITGLLKQLRGGDLSVKQRLAELVYAELRRLASALMQNERIGHTLSPTALTHEVWIRLSSGNNNFRDRNHFRAVAATSMRRLLIDYARARLTIKRDCGSRVPLGLIDIAMPESDERLLAIDEALTRFASLNSRAAQVVELRYFAGLEQKEIAEILNVTRRTVDRDWALARAWLFQEIRVGASVDT
jgi:RNA polymerase sigma factor (TIGR02999 family)